MCTVASSHFPHRARWHDTLLQTLTVTRDRLLLCHMGGIGVPRALTVTNRCAKYSTSAWLSSSFPHSLCSWQRWWGMSIAAPSPASFFLFLGSSLFINKWDLYVPAWYGCRERRKKLEIRSQENTSEWTWENPQRPGTSQLHTANHWEDLKMFPRILLWQTIFLKPLNKNI